MGSWGGEANSVQPGGELSSGALHWLVAISSDILRLDPLDFNMQDSRLRLVPQSNDCACKLTEHQAHSSVRNNSIIDEVMKRIPRPLSSMVDVDRLSLTGYTFERST